LSHKDLLISPDFYDERLKNWGYAVTDLARRNVEEEVTIPARESRWILVNFNLPPGVPEIETFFLMLLNVTSPEAEAARRSRWLFKKKEEPIEGKITLFVNGGLIDSHGILLSAELPCSDVWDLKLTGRPDLLKWRDTNEIEIRNESTRDLKCKSIEYYIAYKPT